MKAARRSALLILVRLLFLAPLFSLSAGQSTSSSDEPDLTRFSAEQLTTCFDRHGICGAWEDMASGWPISDELVRRGGPHQLLVRYWKEPKWAIRDGIEHVAYHFDNAEVTSFMQRVMTEQIKNGEKGYWPINYLAKKCDVTA